jgi:hypothetical protein
MSPKSNPEAETPSLSRVCEIGPQSVALLKVLGDVIADLCMEVKALNGRLDAIHGSSDDETEVECQQCSRTFHAGDEPFVRVPGGDLICQRCYIKNPLQFATNPVKGKTLMQVFKEEAEENEEE